ncbi:MAG TPA: hypothetical protein VHA14_09095 [Bryobacteraceae bacterium]|nr:hypothetical protein [Bryobacteraceae bacterium]
MLTIWVAAGMFLAICGLAGLVQLVAWIRRVDANRPGSAEDVDPDRYNPMLRLLAGYEDEPLAGTMGAENRARIRAWIMALAHDYSLLLKELRLVMVQSGEDRPDLAKALLSNRLLFAVALFRLDLRLRLLALGIGGIEAFRTETEELTRTVRQLRGQLYRVESAVWGA